MSGNSNSRGAAISLRGTAPRGAPLEEVMGKTVPLPDKRNSADSLENFAKHIAEMFKLGKEQGPLALERKICRLLASNDAKVSATMTAKWVEWRYGKAKERIEHSGSVNLTGIIEQARKRAAG